MKLIDLTKQALDRILPGSHQSALLALSLILLALTFLQKSGANKPESLPDSHIVSPGALRVTTPPAPDAGGLLLDVPAQSLEQATNTPADKRLYLTVNPGDNLSLLFKRAGLGPTDVYKIIHGSQESKVLNTLYPGDKLAFHLSNDKQLSSLELFKSPLESFLFTLTSNTEISFTKISRAPHLEVVYKEAIISDSLFLAAQNGGIPASMAMELAGIFSGVIDFILDTREGDTFNIIYEEEYLDGEFIGNGKILAASFSNQGITYTAVRYENSEGGSNFFNPQGESMRKAFLRNPVDFTRISSNFSVSRAHPILNTIRAHKGTDYSAPKGTPVVATADGRVSSAGRNGSFGKIVVIKHGDRFETKYAHLNDYAKGIKAGARVKQGQVIGYVGSTGGATGPHLHYEFLMDGVHRNARTIHDQLPKAESIPGSEMSRFTEQANVRLSLLQARGVSIQTTQNNRQLVGNTSEQHQTEAQ